MIILTETTDKIQVVLDAAVATTQLQCIASYRDASVYDFAPNRSVVASNNTTAVDLVSGASAGYSRAIDYISIYNKDTASALVNVNAVLNSASYTLWRGHLGIGEKIEYVEGMGFTLKNSNAAKAVQQSQRISSPSILVPQMLQKGVVVLNKDYSYTPDASYQGIPGLSFPVQANVMYFFQFFIRYQTEAATTGTAFSINGPPFNYISYDSNYSLAATTVTTNQILIAYRAGTLATDTTNTPNARAEIRGILVPSVDGYIGAEVNTETGRADSAIIKAGSFVEFKSIYQY